MYEPRLEVRDRIGFAASVDCNCSDSSISVASLRLFLVVEVRDGLELNSSFGDCLVRLVVVVAVRDGLELNSSFGDCPVRLVLVVAVRDGLEFLERVVDGVSIVSSFFSSSSSSGFSSSLASDTACLLTKF